MSLPESLERAASELTALADRIRPANGDPDRLIEELNAEQAGEVLCWILGDELDAGAELIEVWEETEAGQAILLGLSEEGLAKPGRKLLRRSHHRLRSRGVEIPEQPAAPQAKVRVVGGEDAFEAACLSVPDYRGERIGYLADRHPSGGARLFEIRFSEGRGVIEFKVYNAGRSKVRGFLRSLSSAQSHRLFDVPREALCALVRRASAAQPIDRPLPNGFVEWRGRLFSQALEKAPTPGALVRETLAEEVAKQTADAAAEEVASLVIEGEAGPWPPPPEWVNEWMERGREQLASLEGDALEKAIAAFSSEMAQALIAETDEELLSRHLEELAWVRWQMENPTAAASLLCAAENLKTDPSISEKLAAARIESLLALFFKEMRESTDGQ